MIKFSAHYYEAKRTTSGWLPLKEKMALPLLQINSSAQRDVLSAFCEARYLIGKTRPPKEGEIAYIRLSTGTGYSAAVDSAERKMEYAGLDRVVGKMRDERILWDAALGMAAQQGRKDEAAALMLELSGLSFMPDWQYVKCALDLGLSVKVQCIGDDPDVTTNACGDFMMATPQDGEFYIPRAWSTHHLYIVDARATQNSNHTVPVFS